MLSEAVAMRAGAIDGFTLIEVLIVLTIAGVFATFAIPSFEGAVRRAHRADALVAATQVQAAQERLRSQGSRYGSLAEIGAPAASPGGYYALQMRRFDTAGYELLAAATGLQARDTDCRFMAVRASGLNLSYASGSSAGVANADALNRRCWSL